MHCDYKTGDKSNLKKHIEKTHMGITYSCSICQQVFNLKERLKGLNVSFHLTNFVIR